MRNLLKTGTQRKISRSFFSIVNPFFFSFLFFFQKREFHPRWVHHQLPCMVCCYLGTRIIQLSSGINQAKFLSIPFGLGADIRKTWATAFDLKGCQNLYRLARLKGLLSETGQGCSPTAKDSCLSRREI